MSNENIPLAKSDYSRGVAKEARILMRNRFFEQNPVLAPSNNALIARPALRKLIALGLEAKVRGLYSQAGTFSDALFAVMGNNLYKIATDATVTDLGAFSSLESSVTFAAVGNIEDNPEKLFFADGANLFCYVEDGYAKGTLTATAIVAADVVRIDSVYYTFSAGSVDTGTPAGTLANPWKVNLGVTIVNAIDNLYNAINDTGVAGTDYSTVLVEHPTVTANFKSTDTIVVNAKDYGIFPNTIPTTETGANISWAAATLTGGGTEGFFPVPTPDSVGIVSVAHINSYVMCVPAQGQGVNGRFYWIEPGEIIVDPVNFATAERAPDPIYEVVVFGDQFWLPGQTTTEVWYLTGDQLAPVTRLQGVVFDRGAWRGTAIQIKDSMMIIDSDGGVFQISGGIKRVSTPNIEERIRKAIAYQQSVS